MSLAASEIQIFFRMGFKMNDSSDALPTMARYNEKYRLFLLMISEV